MRSLLAGVAIALLTLPAVAQQQVYPGCATPPTTFNHVWYIDPVNGKTVQAGGLGTQAAPWNSLQALFEPAPSPTGSYPYPLLTTTPYVRGATGGWVPGPLGGPVAPGDEVLLMSGNYGAISIGEYEIPINNGPGFVTIAAAPGQMPVISSLKLSASSDFVFRGVKFQSLAAAANTVVTIGDQGATYPAANIVLDNVSVSSADPSAYATWTQAQWEANAGTGISAKGSNNGAYTTCVAITNSHLYALHFGIWLATNNSLIEGNEIDHFGDDAVDYSASNLDMNNNYIHDALNFGVEAHPDAFQGYSGTLVPPATYFTWENININNNVIIEQTGLLDPSLVMWLDGIDNYSYGLGAINNLNVSGNVVMVSSGTGILFSNLTNSSIHNNTVIPLGLPAGSTVNPSGPRQGWPNIVIGQNTAGILHENINVYSNVMSGLNVVPAGDATINVHDNTILTGNTGALIFWVLNGQNTWIGLPGVYGNNNLIGSPGGGPCTVTCMFASYDPTHFSYNLSSLSAAPARAGALPVIVNNSALFVSWGAQNP